MNDLDRLALAMPETSKDLSDDGRPTYRVHGKHFVLQRGLRKTRSTPRRASPGTTS